MQLFFDSNVTVQTKIIELNSTDSAHLIKVLRYKKEDNVFITNGKGLLFHTKLINANPQKAILQVEKTEPKNKNRNYFLHIAIAPTKNTDRIEWFTEKAVEIGIDRITPVICDHSERRKLKTERLRKKAVAALKQSLKFHLPQIDEPIPLKNLLEKNFDGAKFIALCNAQNTIYSSITTKKNLILIGPEGGFSKKEINFALEKNFIPVKLSNFRLRTETAAIVATTAFSLKF